MSASVGKGGSGGKVRESKGGSGGDSVVFMWRLECRQKARSDPIYPWYSICAAGNRSCYPFTPLPFVFSSLTAEKALDTTTEI
jgi:hypothetical protein